MFVPFEKLSPASRLWIYQADRKISADEKTILESRLKLFTDGWAAHGQGLHSSYQLAYDQFLILAADESAQNASGCSIDDAVRFVQTVGAELKIDFFNRNQVAFLMGTEVTLIPLPELKAAFAEGKWTTGTLTFNNLINEKSQLQTDWVIPAGVSWLKRYVVHEKVAH